MRWLITQADFLGFKPNLKINQESRSKSLFSGVISIITCIVILALTIYFLIQLLTRTDSTMVFNTLPSFEDSRNISDFPYMIGLYSALNAKSLGDEYYS